MKQFLYMFSMLLIAAFTFPSCTGVDPGHRGVEISWGGETNMNEVYGEGLQVGLSWLWNDMVEYDCREQTMTIEGSYLDYDGLDTDVKVTLYYNPDPSSVNSLHSKVGPDFRESKLKPLFIAAVRTEVAKHQALELNRKNRPEAEANLLKELQEDLGSMFVQVTRVQILDVDLPDKISKMIEQAKEQDERNNLAAKLKLEAENRGAAKVAAAKANLEAARLDAQTKAILSQPAMLKLKELEIDQTWADKGVSKYGNNNVFGSNTTVVKGLGGN